MIWKYTPGRLPRFGINWWLNQYHFGIAFNFPVYIYLSSYWNYESAFMMFGFCVKTVRIGLNFQKIKFITATNLAKRVSGFLRYRILVREFFCSFSKIAGFASRSIGKQVRLYSLRELREGEDIT